MEKLELLSRIRKLSSLVHSEDLVHYNFTEESIREMRRTLDQLTEEYITCYC